MKNNIPIRVLQIIPSAYQGSGVLRVVLNWHQHIDKTKVQFDYLFSKPAKNSARDEIEKLGGRIYELPHPYEHPVQFLSESYRFFKERQYHTVHSHMTNLNLIFYPLAKWFGAKNIIQHAHGTKWSDKKLNGWRNYLMLHAVWPLITYKIACSWTAGKVYFGKKFTVINNGIDIKRFSYNLNVRLSKRKELGLENNFVIGHIGRFSREKNHRFLIEVFDALSKQKPSAKLVLTGDGPLENEIRSLVMGKGLEKQVLFLGVRTDVAEIYQALDAFVFPSLHEGFGLAAIEAQASGLPCILADTLPPDIFVCNSKKLQLNSVETWVKEIMLCAKDFKRTDTCLSIKQAGFCAENIAQRIQDFYLELEQ